MTAEKEVHVYQPSVRYEIWTIIKKWTPRVVAAAVVLFIAYIIAKHEPLFLFMNILGLMIALPPAYWLMSRFFRVEYFIFLLTNLENMEITPYFFPKKLIREGRWEIDGVKTAFRTYFDQFKDSEIDRIFREIEKINAEIGELEEEREKILKGTPLPKKGLFGRIKRTIISEELKEIEEDIRYLKREKNMLLEELAWTGEDGTIVYVCDQIDRANKKIILSPLHGYSSFELALNAKKFNELKNLLRETMEEYAKMKIDYDIKVTKEAADILISTKQIKESYEPYVVKRDENGGLLEEED